MSEGNLRVLPVASATRAKFHPDGSVRSYPGNTILTHVAQTDPALSALGRLSAELREAAGAEVHSFLPADSFHMTLFRGVNDQLRLPGEWPEEVPLNAPLETVTSIFARRLAGVVLPDRLAMRPNRLAVNPSGEIQLNLVGADNDTDQALAAARSLLAERMRHRRTGDDAYRFHITFSYRTRPLREDRKAQLAQLLTRHFDAFLAECPELVMTGPALCTYPDMATFHPVFPLSAVPSQP